MNQNVFTTIAVTGFTVAFFHAAIPTHWLPFVATGRAQRWSAGKTLSIAALAGTGHVTMTALLGFFLTIFGFVVRDKRWFPWIAGGLLIALGLFYIVRQMRGHSHSHTHLFGTGRTHEHSNHGHDHHHHKSLHTPEVARAHTSDRAAIATLFALLTFSPCEGFLPIYVSGIRFGWTGFVLLTAILSAATVAGMLLFTSLALAGIRNIRFSWFERFESGIMGALLLCIGVLVIAFEH